MCEDDCCSDNVPHLPAYPLAGFHWAGRVDILTPVKPKGCQHLASAALQSQASFVGLSSCLQLCRRSERLVQDRFTSTTSFL